MTMIKMAVLPFTFLAAVVHGGCVGAESGIETEEQMAESAPTAETAASLSSCPGVRIEHIPMKSGSTTLGFLDVYFDGSTGKNCAMTLAAGSASGHATSIDVFLTRCKQTSPSLTCTFDGTPVFEPNASHPGPFHSFAGPVLLSAAKKCIYAEGGLTFNGVTVFVRLPGASHCG